MHNPQEIGNFVRRNLEIVLQFSRHAGEFCQKMEINADHALLEIATDLRLLDDIISLGEVLKASAYPSFGSVVQADGKRLDLHFRDMTNKVMHAGRFEWQHGDKPAVTCRPNEGDRWKSAILDLTALETLCEKHLP